MKIWGKTIHIGAEVLNKLYSFPNSYYSNFTTKDCALGISLASKTCLGKNVP